MTTPGNKHQVEEIEDLLVQLESIIARLDRMDLPMPAVRIAEAIEILTQLKRVSQEKRNSR